MMPDPRQVPIGQLSQISPSLVCSCSWLYVCLVIQMNIIHSNKFQLVHVFSPCNLFCFAFQTKNRPYQSSDHQILLTLVWHGTALLILLRSPMWWFSDAENVYIHKVFPQEPEMIVEIYCIGMVLLVFSWI